LLARSYAAIRALPPPAAMGMAGYTVPRSAFYTYRYPDPVDVGSYF
jgi:hypothetical protein